MSEIDLSKLPAPELVIKMTAEEIFEARLAELKAEGVDINNFTASDPIYRILLAASYRESLLRHTVNEQTLGNMLAFADGAQLDHFAANPIYNLQRLPGEDNAAFKRRIQLSPEAYSVAGPAGKYIYEALSADTNVKDASFDSPQPMHAEVTILSKAGNGTPSTELINSVSSHLMDDGVRPQTDLVAVVAPTILTYSISATLQLANGPDRDSVFNQARLKLQNYVDIQHVLGGQVVLAGVLAALMVEGVVDVSLSNFSEVKANQKQAPYCSAITLN